ncbi:helix-turn-helix transcriptional regulator [Frankia sp. AiPa1]|uniref:helix-turn-helix domain-containing protein n=1 Tax=Frankia sp. AiPa1 TaxID=573492 RepID=UPI00202B867A|nr:helix-turn-helix transcriptional regulator [Frankia sp. AiPa1]MCL9758844.1 helix-turn-helix transcriptional regulator [Frankia sp. AiPa1]
MARPESPLPSVPGPVRDFAAALRELRQQAGAIPYRQLAKAAHFSPAHLARAADGRALPRWEVASAYVRACGGNLDEWQERWRAARVASRSEPPPVLLRVPRMRLGDPVQAGRPVSAGTVSCGQDGAGCCRSVSGVRRRP